MMYILLDLRVDFELSMDMVPGTNVFCITARGATMDTFPCLTRDGLQKVSDMLLAELDIEPGPTKSSDIIHSLRGFKIPTKSEAE